jgi:enoyl-CoA hydratase/carnithine racemase
MAADPTSHTLDAAAAQIAFAIASGVATLTIANPARRNAMTAAMWGALPGLLARAVADADVRVIVLRGAGQQAFCAGADISEFESARAGEAVAAYDALNHAAFEALSGCPKPTIAMVHGFCMGGGLGLALACDLRIADTAAQFALPPAKLGLGYNPRWIGPILRAISPADAKLLLFTGRRIPAEHALTMGLVTKLCEADDLEVVTMSLAAEIAANAPLSVKAAKAMVDQLSAAGARADMAALDAMVAACFASADYAEGRRAFLEKRTPVFRGT